MNNTLTKSTQAWRRIRHARQVNSK